MAKNDILEFADAYKTLKEQYYHFIGNLKAISQKYEDFIALQESGDEQKFVFRYLNKLFAINFDFRFDEDEYYHYGVLTLKRITRFKQINNVVTSQEEQGIRSKSEGLFDSSKQILFSKTGAIFNPAREKRITDQLCAEEILFGWLGQFIRSAEFKDTIHVSIKDRGNPNVQT